MRLWRGLVRPRGSIPAVKPIRFTAHARAQMAERGTDEAEVTEPIRQGERRAAKRGRWAYRRNFRYDDVWGDRAHAIKQVLAIVAHEPERLIVVTVYTFYF